MQYKYWKTMVKLKQWEFYLDLYADSSYKNQRLINIILAIASSSSIACWAIWAKFSFVWALLIAISQIINVINPLLPFNKRLEIIKPLIYEIKLLFNKADNNWCKISNGEFTDNEINKFINQLTNDYIGIQNKYLSTHELLEKRKLNQIAQEKTNDYFSSMYDIQNSFELNNEEVKA